MIETLPAAYLETLAQAAASLWRSAGGADPSGVLPEAQTRALDLAVRLCRLADGSVGDQDQEAAAIAAEVAAIAASAAGAHPEPQATPDWARGYAQAARDIPAKLLTRLKKIEQPAGHWPAGDVVSILTTEWFPSLGIDINGPGPYSCRVCEHVDQPEYWHHTAGHAQLTFCRWCQEPLTQDDADLWEAAGKTADERLHCADGPDYLHAPVHDEEDEPGTRRDLREPE
jgi:hypothetical protein